MFPLGSVVVPRMVLPLHVFEPRYRRLVQDCLAGDREFGVVLIERGSEVGGGDVRTDAGTVVRIARADEQPDGRFLVAAVGVRRLRVERWLADDPYPRADVVDWPDVALEASPDGDAVAAALDEVGALLRRTSALRAELGEPAPPIDRELSGDVAVAGYEATALAPLGPADKQALLCAPTVGRRLELLRELLADQAVLLEARLGAG
jgi:Lon protease-like protein